MASTKFMVQLSLSLSLSLSLCVYIYIYRERERDYDSSYTFFKLLDLSRFNGKKKTIINVNILIRISLIIPYLLLMMLYLSVGWTVFKVVNQRVASESWKMNSKVRGDQWRPAKNPPVAKLVFLWFF